MPDPAPPNPSTGPASAPRGPSVAPGSGAMGPKRSLGGRLFAVQESGLVLVIAAMMVILTVFGGGKPSPVMVTIPAEATHTVKDGATENDPSVLSITPKGGLEQTHQSTSGWRVIDRDDGTKLARGSTRISKFFNKENLVLQTTNASYIAVMAVGMTAIIILAGIDLSIGSIYALAALLGAQALNTLFPDKSSSLPLTILAAMVICSGVGAVAGFINGFASVALRVHPFVITLGTMAIYRGLVFVQSGGQTIGLNAETLQSSVMKVAWNGVYPVPTLIMLAVALAGMFILNRTVLGRRIYAIGGNEVAAKYAGIPVGRVKVLVYTIAGALAGLSGCMYLGYFASAENNAGSGYELKVIAAAVIGGASLSGGRGSAIGAVLGAILVQLIDNGLVILGIDQSYNQIVMGAAIILAVVVDQMKGRVTR